MGEEDNGPRRRSSDLVTYREMVAFMSDSEAKMTTARAESLTLISNTLEKMERELDEHNRWHREVLQGQITQATSNRPVWGSVIVAILATVSSTILGVALLIR